MKYIAVTLSRVHDDIIDNDMMSSCALALCIGGANIQFSPALLQGLMSCFVH